MGGIGSGGYRLNAGRKSEDGIPKTKLSITMPEWLAELVRNEADRTHRPMSNLIADLIKKGIEA